MVLPNLAGQVCLAIACGVVLAQVVAGDEGEHSLPAVGERIAASGYDLLKPDCGMSAAKVFDAPIPGLTKIGELRVPHAREIPEASSASIGFGGLKVPGTTGGVSVVWLTAVDVARGCD